MMKVKRMCSLNMIFITTLLAILCLPSMLLADNQPQTGVITISQKTTERGGVTSSDKSGFPVTIDSPGSYRLVSNLTVPDGNTTAIEIDSNNVTIDLNGFSIIGPVSSGLGRGINSTSYAGDNVTIINGSIIGVGNFGIFVRDNCRIENVHAISNGLVGISTGAECTIKGNIVANNDNSGIIAGSGSTVSYNIAEQNGSRGIDCNNSVVTWNTAVNNVTDGFHLGGGGSTVINNTSINNGGHGFNVWGSSTIYGNTATGNGGNGIVDGDGTLAKGNSLVMNNTVSFNVYYGLNLHNGTGYANNVINNNIDGTVTGGVPLGTNVCNGDTTCP